MGIEPKPEAGGNCHPRNLGSSSTHRVHFLHDGKAYCRKFFCWKCVADHSCVAEEPAEPGLGCKRGSSHMGAAGCKRSECRTSGILTASERGRIKMQHDRPDFPTMEQVEKANHEQLARWYRFLPSGDTKEQQKIMDRIAERFKRLGGMTPALEKKIGF